MTSHNVAPVTSRVWYGSNWIRRSTRLAIYARDNFTCVYCQRDLIAVDKFVSSLDHVIPVCQGGTNEAVNLVTCCKKCNDTKNGKTMDSWELVKPGSIDRMLDAVSTPLNRKLGRMLASGEVTISRQAINEWLKEQGN